MKAKLLERAYKFLDEMAPVTTKSSTGRVTGNTPSPSPMVGRNPSVSGKSANAMTRRAVNTGR